MQEYSRVYATIDLDAICENLKNIAGKLQGKTKIFCVVKANGYGHGAIPIAKEVEQFPFVLGFAVATMEEAICLRKAGVKKKILILGYVFPAKYEDIFLWNITPAVFDEDSLTALNEIAAKRGEILPIHVKVDTGMSRIGVRPDQDGMSFIKKAKSCENICIEGMFTHLSQADMVDKSFTHEQIKCFKQFVKDSEQVLGKEIPIKHCYNSAALVDMEATDMEAARPGIIQYGLWPSDEVDQSRITLRPALSLHSQIVYIKEVEAGVSVGYGGTFVTSTKMKIATIPVGYGDGYPRGLSNKGSVLIGGERAPIIGRICMDQFMVDVTKIEQVQVGDPVTLIGRDGENQITAEEVGELSGRFNYELTCELNDRIPRVYIRDGKMKYKKDFFNDYSIEMI